MTKEQLARWRELGFEFDDFHDTIAVDAKPEVSIKFISAKQDEKQYTVKVAFTAKNCKTDIATISLNIVPKPLSFLEFAMVKNVKFKGDTNTFEFKFDVNPFELNKFEEVDFKATLSIDGLQVVTQYFQIENKKGKDERKNDIDINGRMDVKDLKPSSKFYLWLKNKEGLGYNIKYEKKEIVKIFPYDDEGEMGKGNATIGYGHLIDKKPFDAENEKHKKWKDGITLSEADKLLLEDVNSKIKLLEGGLGDGETKGIKVKLLQREYDALLLAIYNGGYGLTLEKMINRGVEKLTKEEIFKTFLFRRNKGSNVERGLISRRASEASIFVYDNWMPYPSEKFKDYNDFIIAYQKFLKNGILPIILFLITCLLSCNKKIDQKIEKKSIKPYFQEQYQKNEILNDENDIKLNTLDTVLNFTSSKLYYEVKVKKNNVDIKISRWNELPDGIIAYQEHGFHKNGYVYMRDMLDSTKYSIQYKILLNKGLFYWNGQNWVLVNAGNY